MGAGGQLTVVDMSGLGDDDDYEPPSQPKLLQAVSAISSAAASSTLQKASSALLAATRLIEQPPLLLADFLVRLDQTPAVLFGANPTTYNVGLDVRLAAATALTSAEQSASVFARVSRETGGADGRPTPESARRALIDVISPKLASRRGTSSWDSSAGTASFAGAAEGVAHAETAFALQLSRVLCTRINAYGRYQRPDAQVLSKVCDDTRDSATGLNALFTAIAFGAAAADSSKQSLAAPTVRAAWAQVILNESRVKVAQIGRQREQ